MVKGIKVRVSCPVSGCGQLIGVRSLEGHLERAHELTGVVTLRLHPASPYIQEPELEPEPEEEPEPELEEKRKGKAKKEPEPAPEPELEKEPGQEPEQVG